MSWPTSLTSRIVKGRFVTYPDGLPAKGMVRIALNDFMQGPTDDLFVIPFERNIPLDDNGAFSVLLPATDDPQWTPSFYKITVETITTSQYPSRFSLLPQQTMKLLKTKLYVPYNATTPIDLADVVNLPAPTPTEQYVLLASKGVAGGVASLGVDGKVPTSQLPAGGGGGGTVSWDDVEDKPSTFPHDPIAFADVTGKPSVYPANPTAWADIPGKPTTFPPTAIAFSDITDKPATYPSSWTEVSGKPVTFTPAAHVHATSDVTGLDAALSGKASSVHTHAQSDITGLASSLSAKADATATTTALGLKADTSAVTTALASKADLVAGVIPTAQLPSITVIDFLGTVATQSAMLALTGQKGDWAIRSDLGQAWVITGTDPTQLASWTAMPLGTSPVQTVNGQTGTVVLGKSDVGLSAVDNTTDAGKPVSTAQLTALNLKAPLASPAFTGTVTGVTATMVGLGSVNNTTDAGKPVSTAQQTALDLKATLASPTFTGTPAAPTATAATSTTQLATTAFVTTADNLKAPLASPTFTGTPAAPTAAAATNTTQLATTAFVTTADNLKAPLASPTFTGTPAAPTAAVGTNTTQVATTAFVIAQSAKVLVLTAAGSVPGGTPTGTVIVRTTT